MKIGNLKSQKDFLVGKFLISELWSEKFHKLVMRESKISDILEKQKKLKRQRIRSGSLSKKLDLISSSSILQQSVTLRNLSVASKPFQASHFKSTNLNVVMNSKRLDKSKLVSFKGNPVEAALTKASNSPALSEVDKLIKKQDHKQIKVFNHQLRKLLRQCNRVCAKDLDVMDTLKLD